MASAASFEVTSAMCSWCWCASLPAADMMLRLTRLWESAPLAADLLGLGRGDLREGGGVVVVLAGVQVLKASLRSAGQ